jgi:hypothetical protein
MVLGSTAVPDADPERVRASVRARALAPVATPVHAPGSAVRTTTAPPVACTANVIVYVWLLGGRSTLRRTCAGNDLPYCAIPRPR